jgi:hypothetical protein
MVPFSFIRESVVPVENEIQSWPGSEIILERFVPLVQRLRQIPVKQITSVNCQNYSLNVINFLRFRLWLNSDRNC